MSMAQIEDEGNGVMGKKDHNFEPSSRNFRRKSLRPGHVGDLVNLEADNRSRGCRMPHERTLLFKHRPCGAMKLLKTRGNWMKAVVVTGTRRGRREEKAWNENGVRRKKDIRSSSVLPAPSTAVSTRSFRTDPQPLIPKNRRRAIKIIRLQEQKDSNSKYKCF